MLRKVLSPYRIGVALTALDGSLLETRRGQDALEAELDQRIGFR